MYIIYMKRLLYINWYDEDSILHEIHYKCLCKYNSLFDEVFIVINTRNRHDTNRIHNIKNSFDVIFNNRVSFKVEQIYDDQENIMFETYFLPLIDKYPNDYSIIYFINDETFNMKDALQKDYCSLNFKLWTAANYYFNFENINEHMDALLNKEYAITGGIHYKIKMNYGDYSVNEFFPGCFYGINVVNLLKLYNEKNITDRYKTFINPELHFFTFIPENKIHSDSKIHTFTIDSEYIPVEYRLFNECENFLKFNLTSNEYQDILNIVKQ